MSYEKVSFMGELLVTLTSKRQWVNQVPDILPDKKRNELWIWLDANGNHLQIGEDFAVADKIKSFPVKVYRVQRVAESVINHP